MSRRAVHGRPKVRKNRFVERGVLEFFCVGKDREVERHPGLSGAWDLSFSIAAREILGHFSALLRRPMGAHSFENLSIKQQGLQSRSFVLGDRAEDGDPSPRFVKGDASQFELHKKQVDGGLCIASLDARTKSEKSCGGTPTRLEIRQRVSSAMDGDKVASCIQECQVREGRAPFLQ